MDKTAQKFRGCRQCRKEWNDCLCPSWPLHLIVFSRPQVFWMLTTGFDFEGEAGYNDDRVDGTHNKTSAPFESLSCVIAEVEARLALCGDAGEALEDEAKYIELVDYLSRPARRALNYVSGFRRRRQTYSRWCWEQEQKKKEAGDKPAP